MRGGRLSLLVTALVIVATGCIGATDRADFDAEVRARGGGVTADWIADAIDEIAAEVGAPSASELMVMSLNVNSTNRTVVAVARRGDRPEFVDTVVVSEGNVVAVTPMQDADRLALDEVMFRVGDLPIDDLENISDRAIEKFGEADGFVDSITVSLRSGRPTVVVSLNSARRTGTIQFDQSGVLLEVER